jgi:isoamylase
LRTMEHERKRTSLAEMLAAARATWHGVKLNQPDWGDHSRSIALNAALDDGRLCFHIILNAYWEPLDFALPQPPALRQWRRWIDTGLESPLDICDWENAAEVSADRYRVDARSVVMMFAEPDVDGDLAGSASSRVMR